MNETLMLTPQAEEMAARAEIIRRFQDPVLMTSLIQKAVRDAVLEHKRNGNPRRRFGQRPSRHFSA